MQIADVAWKVSAGPIWSLPEAARYLDVAVQTLYQWRSRGIGPKGFKVGNRVKFRQAELDRWLAEQERAEQDRLSRIAG